MNSLTWTCHVCGKERPDEKISVWSKKKMIGTVEMTVNVRYCNDNSSCLEGAPNVSWAQ